MKRVIIIVLIILIFAGLSIGVTAALIQAKNNENTNQNQTNEISNNVADDNLINNTNSNIENNSINKSNEKTIDLRGTYNQNDLIIEEINYEGIRDKLKMPEDPYMDKSNYLKVPQISGLKNKQVQEKINTHIKKSIDNKIENILKNNNVKDLTFRYGIPANFANVLSVRLYLYSNKSNIHDNIILNYKLTNGENLKFEELFKQDEDLKSVLRMAIYRCIAEKQRDEQRYDNQKGYSNIYYDNEKGAWYATYYERDNQGNVKTAIKEYISPISEYEIEKLINKFLKQENKKFSFSPSTLEIEFDDLVCSLELKDIADKVVIYNKFLTSESLYEKDNIGVKNIITCSAETYFGKYKETKYESDNFFYDICLQPENDGGSDPYRNKDIESKYKFLQEKMEEAKNSLNNKVKEYKNIAKNNPDKAYFLFSKFVFAEYEDKNQVVSEFYNKVIVCDIKEKEEVLEKILSCYRYYHIYYYGTIYEYLEDRETTLFKEYTINENVEKIYYDPVSGKEYKRENKSL